MARTPDLPQTPTDDESLRLEGIRVLAAEDSEITRMVLTEILRGEGAELTCFENGRQVIDHLERHGDAGYQILLTDIQMPELDGYQTARRCRERFPGLPVVGLSVHALAEAHAGCLDSGMIDQVEKPLDIDRLVAAVRRYARPRPRSQDPEGTC